MQPRKVQPLNTRPTPTGQLGGTIGSQTGGTESPLTPLRSSPTHRLSRASNGTLGTATPLGAFPPGRRKFKDTLGQGNAVDFFQLDLTTRGKIKLNLFNQSGAGAPITGSILNANGRVVSLNGQRQTFSVAANSRGETLIKSATPGTYYLRVQGTASRNTAYEVDLFVSRPGGPQPLPCGCGV